MSEEEMARCLRVLSSMMIPIDAKPISMYRAPASFECKTCNRRFSSFQALGGHRASHKKPAATMKMKLKHHHHCSVCGLVFSTGQALGGHMRRHRSASPPPRCFDLNLTPLENDFFFLFPNNP